ncbi:unnamed protein product [Pleuronectes platessa]|uniref:Uncharacterized protein n=1 Tax=Pleuronectes platessa TaxID=8262 RepID=A0A9N7TGW4_PLEPL|nr:unnamed protein product [Pleuronectes platessa]
MGRHMGDEESSHRGGETEAQAAPERPSELDDSSGADLRSQRSAGTSTDKHILYFCREAVDKLPPPAAAARCSWKGHDESESEAVWLQNKELKDATKLCRLEIHRRVLVFRTIHVTNHQETLAGVSIRQ